MGIVLVEKNSTVHVAEVMDCIWRCPGCPSLLLSLLCVVAVRVVSRRRGLSRGLLRADKWAVKVTKALDESRPIVTFCLARQRTLNRKTTNEELRPGR